MYGITFNKKHSYNDFNLKVTDRKNNPPSKVKIKEKVPFMNGEYDFSNIYGSQLYEERVLEYEFILLDKDRKNLQFEKMQIENWFNNTNGKVTLTDDDSEAYYYLAECENIDFEEFYSLGKFKVTFSAYPFKISKLYEGHDIWDSFNFVTDVAQKLKFSISERIDIVIYNQSATNIIPSVIVTGEIRVVIGNTVFYFDEGINNDPRLQLLIGANNIGINGNGTIEFRFKREVL